MFLAAICAVALGIAGAAAQPYPSRPISLIVPYPAGGPLDQVARVMTEHMRGTLGQPFVIENVSGAGGSIGVGRVARAAPNGYTIGIGDVGTQVLNGAVYPLDLRRDDRLRAGRAPGREPAAGALARRRCRRRR